MAESPLGPWHLPGTPPGRVVTACPSSHANPRPGPSRQEHNARKDPQVPAPVTRNRSSDRGLLAAWFGMHALVAALALIILGTVGVISAAMFLTSGRGRRGR